MSPTEVGLAAGLGSITVALATVIFLMVWFRGGGDPEVLAIREEREGNEWSARRAALRASERTASASALGREVRHTRREIAAEAREKQHEHELAALTGPGLPGGAGAAPIPPPPPPPP